MTGTDEHQPRPAPPDRQTREQRLAAKLRENLRRRKQQARALGADDEAGDDRGPVTAVDRALPKPSPES